MSEPQDLPRPAQALAIDGPAAGELLPRPVYGSSVIYREMHDAKPGLVAPALPDYTDHTYWLVRLSFGGRIIHTLSWKPDGLQPSTPELAAATFFLLSEKALACIDDALDLEVSRERTA